MGRRKFSREFKLEAVNLITDRGVSFAQAGRDLEVHENVLCKWVHEFGFDSRHAFPGQGQMKPEHWRLTDTSTDAAMPTSVSPASAAKLVN